jgi:hypothetical protein
MQSVRDTNPEYRRYLILADKQPLENICSDGLFEIIEADALGIDCFDDMVLRYDVMEFNTAIKPFAMDWLFENTDAENVIYLDPDICVYRELTELNEALASGASVVVTPHLTKPLEDGKTPNDYHMLQAGVFNLGFFAASRKQEAREFIRWWSRRLKTMCYSDVPRNLFTDQRWVDLVPCFISDLMVLRSPAYNVAYWNLMQRPISRKKGRLHLDGEELAFFHFSGLDRGKSTVVSKHQDRLAWHDIRPLHSLFLDYRGRLADNGWEIQSKVEYHYDRVGFLKVAQVMRRLYRSHYPDALEHVSMDELFLLAMCNKPSGIANDPEGRVTKLMHYIYRERPDLQSSFPLISPKGIEGFINWYRKSAAREYGLEARLVDPSLTAIEIATAKGGLPPSSLRHPNDGKPWLYRKWRKIRKAVLELTAR